ncbi:MAG: hypothetical protein ACI9P8_001521, partial [Bacteroidia bacterium]
SLKRAVNIISEGLKVYPGKLEMAEAQNQS